MSLEYTWEKLSVAVGGMVRSQESLQDRLMGAYLCFHPLREGDFPEGELRKSFHDIMHALTWQPAKGDEGTVRATTQQMTDQEASDLIEKLFSLYEEITRLDGIEEYQAEKKISSGR